jgi:beta-glucosidase-like glycosyl hydrolase
VLTEKFRLGLFENPYADENGIDLQNETTRQVAREVATKSVTLLENNGILPLGGKPAWRWWGRRQTIRWRCSAATASRCI